MAWSKHYRAFGFEFASEIELPGVPEASPRGTPEVIIRLGSVPEETPAPDDLGPACEAGPGQFLLSIDKVARYFVRDGREIVVDPLPGANRLEVRLFLKGSAFGALLHQRGLVPLHASAVRVGTGCVAFLGDTRSGKSTLAAFLRRRGYQVLCDDGCPFEVLAESQAVIWPGFPRIKLWADSLESLGIAVDSVFPMHTEMEKYELPVEQITSQEPVPVRRLYVLQETRNQAHEGIERINRTARLETLVMSTYRFGFMEELSRQLPHFESCSALSHSTSIYRFVRQRDLGRIDETLDCLEHDFEGIPA